jgi:hypothetical protein
LDLIFANPVLSGALASLPHVNGTTSHPAHSPHALAAQAPHYQADLAEITSLTNDGLTGDTVVAFFSTNCSACHDRLREFLAHFTAVGGHTRVLVVVSGPAETTPTMVPALTEVVTVIREEDNQDTMNAAFAVRGYPVLFQLRDDTVTAFGTSTAALAAPATV